MSIILGLSGGYFHDAASALVIDGELIAFCEEERFTRRKHNVDFRTCAMSTRACLDRAGIELSDVDEIIVPWDPDYPNGKDLITDEKIISKMLPAHFFNGFQPKAFRRINHHLAHAASSFFSSGFEDSIVLVVDASGDGESTTIWHGSKDGLKKIKGYDYTQSVGWFYDRVTDFCGLGGWLNACKTMGLAPFGKPRFTFPFINVYEKGYSFNGELVGLKIEGSKVDDYNSLEYFRRLKKLYDKSFLNFGIEKSVRSMKVIPGTGLYAEETELTEDVKDLAASAQKILEDLMISMAHECKELVDSSNLCLAGGVALNCKANGVIARSGLYKSMFVQPASGDAGGALGGALYRSFQIGERKVPDKAIDNMYWGPEFSEIEIEQALKQSGLQFSRPASLSKSVAKLIDAGNVIAWFQGRMEAGPRALGNRSFIADPRSTKLRDHINSNIKQRELWRPFAPSVLEERLSDYVIEPSFADFMIVAYEATELGRKDLAGAVHVDGTLRPQSVKKSVNSKYHELISEFEKLSGVGGLLNTSFNMRHEPIVCTPGDALRTFVSCPVDVLAIGNFLVTKP